MQVTMLTANMVAGETMATGSLQGRTTNGGDDWQGQAMVWKYP
jgi:hypothetical protein